MCAGNSAPPPPLGNANYAWLQHILWQLSPNGTAGVVLANGSMSSKQSGEDAIRRAMIEADMVECMIALPGQLFYSTQIPACLWFLSRNKENGRFRNRKGEVLFIDARGLGHMVSRTRKEFLDEDIEKIAGTYHAWRGKEGAVGYADVPGFCASADLETIKGHAYVLTPGRYVGAAETEEDDTPFAERFAALQETLGAQFTKGEELAATIRRKLAGVLADG